MTHPRSMITNLKFTYADQSKKLGGMLRYFTYRDDKDGHTHIPQLDEQGKRMPRRAGCVRLPALCRLWAIAFDMFSPWRMHPLTGCS
jgi:hypothetical protein